MMSEEENTTTLPSTSTSLPTSPNEQNNTPNKKENHTLDRIVVDNNQKKVEENDQQIINPNQPNEQKEQSNSEDKKSEDVKNEGGGIENKQFKKVKSVQLTQSLEGVLSSPQFVKCPNTNCGFIFEKLQHQQQVLAPKIESATSSSSLPPLSHHQIHFNEYRFRCRLCSTEFCASCGQNPYHVGKDCDEYKLFLKAILCRFCKTELSSAPSTPLLPVCANPICKQFESELCNKKLECGHFCGTSKYVTCICMNIECAKKSEGNLFHQTENDLCAICWTEDLGNAPCVILKCGHIFHTHCVQKKLQVKWPGARITFSFAMCPLCNAEIDSPLFRQELEEIKFLMHHIKQHSLQLAKMEKLDLDKSVTETTGKWYNNLQGLAMDTFCYYKCFLCSQPYYGGKRQCENREPSNFKVSELVCGGCSGGADCPKHGHDYIFYKCKYCCSVANWFCFGTTHYCEKCHENPYDYGEDNVVHKVPPQCEGKDKCPLGIEHPLNGFEEFALGCSVCKVENELGVDLGAVPKLNFKGEYEEYEDEQY